MVKLRPKVDGNSSLKPKVSIQPFINVFRLHADRQNEEAGEHKLVDCTSSAILPCFGRLGALQLQTYGGQIAGRRGISRQTLS